MDLKVGDWYTRMQRVWCDSYYKVIEEGKVWRWKCRFGLQGRYPLIVLVAWIKSAGSINGRQPGSKVCMHNSQVQWNEVLSPLQVKNVVKMKAIKVTVRVSISFVFLSYEAGFLKSYHDHHLSAVIKKPWWYTNLTSVTWRYADRYGNWTMSLLKRNILTWWLRKGELMV